MAALKEPQEAPDEHRLEEKSPERVTRWELDDERTGTKKDVTEQRQAESIASLSISTAKNVVLAPQRAAVSMPAVEMAAYYACSTFRREVLDHQHRQGGRHAARLYTSTDVTGRRRQRRKPRHGILATGT